MTKLREYKIGSVTGYGKNKTDARADAERRAAEALNRWWERSPYALTVECNLGGMVVFMVMPDEEGWSYGWMDEIQPYGRLICAGFKTLRDAAYHGFQHVVDNYAGAPDCGALAIQNSHNWLSDASRTYGLYEDDVDNIMSEIDDRRRARLKMMINS